MATNQELIQQIQNIILALQEESKSLSQSSQAFKSNETFINALAGSLQKLRGEVPQTTEQLSKLSARLEKLFSGELLRLNAGDLRVRLKQYQTEIQNALKGIAPATTTATTPQQATVATSEELPIPASAFRNVPGATGGEAAQSRASEKLREREEKNNEALQKALRRRNEILNQFNAANQKLRELQENLGKSVVFTMKAPEIPGSATELDPRKRARLIDQERTEIERSYKTLVNLVKEYEEQLLQLRLSVAREERARVNPVMQERIAAEQERRRLASVEGTARNETDYLAQMGSQNAIGNRLESALGQEPINRAEEEALIRQQQIDRQQEEERVRHQSQQEVLNNQERQANQRMAQMIRERTRQLEAAAEEEARIERMRNVGTYIPGGEKTAAKLDKMAATKGFRREDISNIDIEGTSGITRVTYQVQEAENIIRRARYTVSEFGTVLEDTPRRFQDFGQALVRDFTELMKWSIAISLIYGPLNALNTLMQTTVETQTLLADVMVTLGNATQSTTEIFRAAADISQQIGEETNKVVEAYNQAYRATGNIADSTERFETANQLLTDSLILSKLSTLNEAEAIDTLTAALKQTNTPLSQGTELLDQWVKVTRVANVDLATLATGFAVVGDAAEAVGLKAEQLNAVIAVISETSIQSGKEVANTARAMIAGFQTDQAAKALGQLGISVKTASGEIKPFLSLIKEIKDATDRGIINESQFSKLTLALGGGSRRSAAYSAFISNFNRIDEIVKQQADSEGAAAAALEIKVGTLQTAITRLGNAFQAFGLAIGEKGGVLEGLTGLVNFGTKLVDIFTSITSAAGKATPALLAMAAAFAYLKLATDAMPRLSAGLNSFGKSAGEAVFRNSSILQNSTNLFAAQRAGQAVGRNLPAIAAGGAVAATAISNFAEGNNAQGVGNVLGAAIGGGLGAWAGGPMGAAVGMTLGSAIGEGFANAAQDYKVVFADLFKQAFGEAAKTGQPSSKTPQQQREETAAANLQNLLQKAISSVTNPVGSKVIGVQSNELNNTLAIKLIGEVIKGSVGLSSAMSGTKFNGFTDAQVSIIQLGIARDLGLITKEEFEKLIQEIRAAREAGLPEVPKPTPTQDVALTAVRLQREAELKQSAQSGLTNNASFTRGMQNLQGFSAGALQFEPEVGKYFKDAGDFYKQYSNIVARGTEENISSLNADRQNIIELRDSLGTLKSGSEEYIKTTEALASAQENLANKVKELNREILTQYKALPTIELGDVKFSGGESQATLVRAAMEEYQKSLQVQVDAGVITQEQMQALLEETEKTLITIAGVYDTSVQIPVDFIQKKLDELIKAGKAIKEEKQPDMGFQTMPDVTRAQYNQALQRYEPLRQALMSMGVKSEETPSALILKDQMFADRKDWRIVQYLLQEILKVDQKQLDGMFNLPEGASFWVPAQAAKLAPQPGTTGLDNILKGFNDQFGNAVLKFATTVDQMQAFRAMEQKYPVTPGLYKTTEQQMQAFRRQEEKYPVTTDYGGQQASQMQAFRDWEQKYPVTPNTTSTSSKNMLEEFTAPLENSFQKYFTPLQDTFTTLFESLKNFFTGGPQTNINTNPVGAAPQQNLATTLPQLFSQLSTKFNLTIDSRTTVMLDGRQVAMAMKTYLKNDLLRYSGGANTKTVTMV